MAKRFLVLVLLAAFLAWPGQAVMAAAGGDGQIQGSLINRTAATTSSVAGQVVTLKIYQGTSETGSQTATTDQDGNFAFSGLSTDNSYVYQIEITYQDVNYYSQPLQFGTGETVKSADINVYDTTTSDDAVSVGISYVIISRQDDNLAVLEYYLFADNSDRAYIGTLVSDSAQQRQTLQFVLPPDATDLQFVLGLSDSTVIRNGNDFTDTGAVTPDGRELSYSYLIPIKSDKQVLNWTSNYNVMRFDLLSKDNSIHVTSDKLTEQEPLTISGQSYNDYASQNLPRGGTIAIALSGLTGSSGFNALDWAWLAVIPLAGLAFFLIRRRRSIPAGAENDKQRLLDEIAALDDSYDNGEIDEEDYRKLRKQKKEHLLSLAQIRKDSTTDDRAD
jgi:hypothetical protein